MKLQTRLTLINMLYKDFVTNYNTLFEQNIDIHTIEKDEFNTFKTEFDTHLAELLMCSSVEKLSLFQKLNLKSKFEILNDKNKKVFWSFIHKMFIVTQDKKDEKTKMFVEKSQQILDSFDKPTTQSMVSSSRNIFEKMQGSSGFQTLIGEVENELKNSDVELTPESLDIGSMLSGQGAGGQLFKKIVDNVMHKTQTGEINIEDLISNMKNIL